MFQFPSVNDQYFFFSLWPSLRSACQRDFLFQNERYNVSVVVPVCFVAAHAYLNWAMMKRWKMNKFAVRWNLNLVSTRSPHAQIDLLECISFLMSLLCRVYRSHQSRWIRRVPIITITSNSGRRPIAWMVAICNELYFNIFNMRSTFFHLANFNRFI